MVDPFFVPISVPRLVYQRLYVLSCLWECAYKRPFTANWKVTHAACFLSRYMNCPLPYSVTVNVFSVWLNKLFPFFPSTHFISAAKRGIQLQVQ